MHKLRTAFLPTLDRDLMPDPGRIDDLALDWEGDVTGSLLRVLYNPEKAMLYTANPCMVVEHPAHLHIDILQPYQGQGFGGKMVADFLKSVKGWCKTAIRLERGNMLMCVRSWCPRLLHYPTCVQHRRNPVL